jgi:hypothetical protein
MQMRIHKDFGALHCVVGRDIVPDINDSGPMCIIGLFQDKYLAKIKFFLKSVHFKKPVARISFLSKLWYFEYKSKQKVPQF